MLFTLRATTRLIRRRNNFTTLPPSSSTTSSTPPTSSSSAAAPLSTSAATPPPTPTAAVPNSTFTLRTPTRNRLQKPQRRQSSTCSPSTHLLAPSTPSLRSSRSIQSINSTYTIRTFTSSRASRTLSNTQSVAEEATPPVGASGEPDLSGLERLPDGNVTIINPKKDEEGAVMKVEVTERAVARLRKVVSTDPIRPFLRITVQSGGCHGFQYLMSLESPSTISIPDDTILDAGEGARVVMDEASLGLLKGSKVDYVMELIGSQFKIVGNPRARSSCGCGTSFDIEF